MKVIDLNTQPNEIIMHNKQKCQIVKVAFAKKFKIPHSNEKLPT